MDLHSSGGNKTGLQMNANVTAFLLHIQISHCLCLPNQLNNARHPLVCFQVVALPPSVCNMNLIKFFSLFHKVDEIFAKCGGKKNMIRIPI